MWGINDNTELCRYPEDGSFHLHWNWCTVQLTGMHLITNNNLFLNWHINNPFFFLFCHSLRFSPGFPVWTHFPVIPEGLLSLLSSSSSLICQPWATVMMMMLLLCPLTLWLLCRNFTRRPEPVRFRAWHHQTHLLWEPWRKTGWVCGVFELHREIASSWPNFIGWSKICW